MTACRLAYIDDAMGQRELFAVEVSGDEWGRYGWRDDTALPALTVAADPDEVARRLEIVLGEPVECVISRCGTGPGSRCVLRYDVVGASGRSTFFAKALQPDAYARIAALHAEPAVHETPPGWSPRWSPGGPTCTWWSDGRSRDARPRPCWATPTSPPTPRSASGTTWATCWPGSTTCRWSPTSTWSADQQVITLADAMAAVECADPAIGHPAGRRARHPRRRDARARPTACSGTAPSEPARWSSRRTAGRCCSTSTRSATATANGTWAWPWPT